MDTNKDKTSKLLINIVYFGLSGAQERNQLLGQIILILLIDNIFPP